MAALRRIPCMIQINSFQNFFKILKTRLSGAGRNQRTTGDRNAGRPAGRDSRKDFFDTLSRPCFWHGRRLLGRWAAMSMENLRRSGYTGHSTGTSRGKTDECEVRTWKAAVAVTNRQFGYPDTVAERGAVGCLCSDRAFLTVSGARCFNTTLHTAGQVWRRAVETVVFCCLKWAAAPLFGGSARCFAVVSAPA